MDLGGFWWKMAPCFGRLKVAGTPSFFRRNLPQPLARQGKSNSRPREQKKRFIQEKKERFRREKARFWEIGEKKERNLALDFSPKMSPLTRESMIHFLLLLAKKAEVYHMKTNHYYSDLLRQYLHT